MSCVKKLYGCIDTKTGELQAVYRAKRPIRGYVSKAWCTDAFGFLLKRDSKYQIVELVPQYLEKEQVCHAQ